MKLLSVLLVIFLSSCIVANSKHGFPSYEYQSLIDKGVFSLNQYDQGKKFELDKAQTFFEMAIDVDPSLASAYDGLGGVEFRKKNNIRAKDYFLKAIELDHEYSRAYANLGYVYAGQGDFLESERLLRKAIALNKKDFLANNNLGSLLYNNDPKNHKEAKILFLKAKEIGTPNDAIVDGNIKIMDRVSE